MLQVPKTLQVWEIAESWDKFWAKVDFEGPPALHHRADGLPCWLWKPVTKREDALILAAKGLGWSIENLVGHRYGIFSLGHRGVGAHRFAYELLVGPIPEGLVIDHLCRVRHCVNPAHLEPVTQAENCRRACEDNPVSRVERASKGGGPRPRIRVRSRGLSHPATQALYRAGSV